MTATKLGKRGCDFRQLVTRSKEPDRLIGWRDPFGNALPASAYPPDPADRLVVPYEGWDPIIEKGTEISTYRGCDRRAGHRGRHRLAFTDHPWLVTRGYALRAWRALRRQGTW